MDDYAWCFSTIGALHKSMEMENYFRNLMIEAAEQEATKKQFNRRKRNDNK